MGQPSSTEQIRSEPASVGDTVAKFATSAEHGARVVAFHPADWDPARADELHAYQRMAATVTGDSVPDVITFTNDSQEAFGFGVYGRSAVFVVDEHDML